jgi:hypothetical protein
MAKRTKSGRTPNRTRGINVSDPDFLATPAQLLGGVWSGSIARLRIYHSTGRVFAYKSPGANANQVGFTDDPNLIHALFLARDNGRSILGYTNNDGSIGFIDY